MHPLLSKMRRLLLYLLVWEPIAALLAYLLTTSGQISAREATILAVPLCLFYAFVCLGAWFSCRFTPIDKSSISKIMLAHGGGALVATGIWVMSARWYAYELTASGSFPGLSTRFRAEVPLVAVTGILLYLLCVAFYYVYLTFEASKDAEARMMKASVLAREAELKALKAQVNPHFLFNSLNSISALTSSNPEKAREMCILLGDFLRRTLGLGEKPAIRLEEELSLIHAFLSVEKVRFGARIQMTETVDPRALNVLVLPLLLQPLVENAVSHGVANLVEGGWIRLSVECPANEISISVENNFDPDAPPRRKSGVGLVNVRQRLKARYGSAASFNCAPDGETFRVALRFPAEKDQQAAVA
jgi:two-component system, LytTR family, sensor histidine kinase AlgZ